MIKRISSAVCAAMLVLSGCQTIAATAVVGMNTDAKGKLARTHVIKSSGNPNWDRIAKDAATHDFRRQVHTPRKNHRYIIQVDIADIQPLWSSEKTPSE